MPGNNHLFLITAKIARGSNPNMPPRLAGAYVPVFAAAANHEAALRAAVSKLVAEGFEFLDVEGAVRQLDPNKWADFVDATFPDFKDQLPGQDAVVAGLAGGDVFFGPFAGYERS